MKIHPNLNQLKFPREWRIEHIDYDHNLLTSLRHLADLISELCTSTTSHDSDPISLNVITDVCTQLWRMRVYLLGGGMVKEDTRKLIRYVEIAWDILANSDIEILDHTGQRIPENGFTSVKTLAIQAHAGLLHDTIIETIKPSIYHRDKLVQLGEVIVGRPIP